MHETYKRNPYNLARDRLFDVYYFPLFFSRSQKTKRKLKWRRYNQSLPDNKIHGKQERDLIINFCPIVIQN